MRIGLLTSGGDAPGMNACIRAVVRTALPRGHQVVGIRRGYKGLLDEDFYYSFHRKDHQMHLRSVSNIIHRGGTILHMARPIKNVSSGLTENEPKAISLAYGRRIAFDSNSSRKSGTRGAYGDADRERWRGIWCRSKNGVAMGRQVSRKWSSRIVSKGRKRASAKLEDLTEEELRRRILRGAMAYGFETDLWTVNRLRRVILDEFGFDFQRTPSGGDFGMRD